MFKQNHYRNTVLNRVQKLFTSLSISDDAREHVIIDGFTKIKANHDAMSSSMLPNVLETCQR